MPESNQNILLLHASVNILYSLHKNNTLIFTYITLTYVYVKANTQQISYNICWEQSYQIITRTTLY